MSEEKTMHVFTDEYDTVVAADLEDAKAVMVAYGIWAEDFCPEAWEQVEDSTPITIHCDEAGNPATPGDKGVAPLTKTAAEWCARGRGFLCTTEY